MDRPEVRASDAERNRAVDLLRDAAAEGRLTFEELADRIGRRRGVGSPDGDRRGGAAWGADGRGVPAFLLRRPRLRGWGWDTFWNRCPAWFRRDHTPPMTTPLPT
jgi:hypothetical protein